MASPGLALAPFPSSGVCSPSSCFPKNSPGMRAGMCCLQLVYSDHRGKEGLEPPGLPCARHPRPILVHSL